RHTFHTNSPPPPHPSLFPFTTLFRSPKTITAGQSAQFMIEVRGQPGFSAAVSFSCSSGVPQGAVCSFNPTSVSPGASAATTTLRSEEHTSELQSRFDLVCRLLLEKKN